MLKFLIPGVVIIVLSVLLLLAKLSRPTVIGYETARPLSSLTDEDLKKGQRRAPAQAADTVSRDTVKALLPPTRGKSASLDTLPGAAP